MLFLFVSTVGFGIFNRDNHLFKKYIFLKVICTNYNSTKNMDDIREVYLNETDTNVVDAVVLDVIDELRAADKWGERTGCSASGPA